VPYHTYHFTPQTLGGLLSQYGFRKGRTKNYHSEYVKQRIEGIPGLKPIARIIASFYSGNSFAVVAKEEDC
jgi:hypothetical protein